MSNPFLSVAFGSDLTWCRQMLAAHHYLRTPADHRCRPLAYIVRLASERVGCLVFGRPESTRCYAGGLTYGSQADVAQGRATYDRWEVLNLVRVCLAPDAQSGGRLCVRDLVPGFTDRKGVWRPALASAVIRLALAQVGFDYLLAHPPCFLDQPYQIRAVLSYCDTRLHRGTIYRVSGFRLARTNAAGVQTWYTTGVAGLTAGQDQAVQRAAERSPRSARIRGQVAAAGGSLFAGVEEGW